MTNRISIFTICVIVASLLAMGIFASIDRNALATQPPTGPAKTAHSAHVTAAVSQATTQTVEARLADLQAKIQRLEAAMQQQSGVMSGAMPTNGMPEMASGGKPTQGNMAGMMGKMGGKGNKGDSGMAMASALPGFPGASHLYHIGATGFFLDHPQHIALSTKQQMMLNQIKEQSALNRASADRSVP